MVGDRSDPPMEFICLVLGADIDGMAGRRRHAEPVLIQRGRCAELKRHERLATASLAGEQRRLPGRDAIPNQPLALRRTNRLVEIDEGETLNRVSIGFYQCSARRSHLLIAFCAPRELSKTAPPKATSPHSAIRPSRMASERGTIGVRPI